jgi:hypothetical protein
VHGARCGGAPDRAVHRAGQPPGPRLYPFDEWAIYRHPDGTAVVLGQNHVLDGADLPELAEAPLTTDQLLELVTDPRFHLD